MRKIPLTQGKYALVDDADYERLNQFKWRAVKGWNAFYAIRSSKPRIWMHREILKLKSNDKKETDHIDHNGLNNQKFNLRSCDSSQNQHNQIVRQGSSRYKGVHLHKKSNYWVARIRVRGDRFYLGCSKKETETAKLYDQAAIKYFGDFAQLNFSRRAGK